MVLDDEIDLVGRNLKLALSGNILKSNKDIIIDRQNFSMN